MPDHVDMLTAMLRKHREASILKFRKGQRSIWIAQHVAHKPGSFVGHEFWAQGYFVSTGDDDEQIVKPTSIPKKKKTDGSMTCLTGKE